MKGERPSIGGGDIEVSSYHSYTYEKRTDLYCDLSKKNIGKQRSCAKFIWLKQKKNCLHDR